MKWGYDTISTWLYLLTSPSQSCGRISRYVVDTGQSGSPTHSMKSSQLENLTNSHLLQQSESGGVLGPLLISVHPVGSEKYNTFHREIQKITPKWKPYCDVLGPLLISVHHWPEANIKCQQRRRSESHFFIKLLAIKSETRIENFKFPRIETLKPDHNCKSTTVCFLQHK